MHLEGIASNRKTIQTQYRNTQDSQFGIEKLATKKEDGSADLTEKPSGPEENKQEIDQQNTEVHARGVVLEQAM